MRLSFSLQDLPTYSKVISGEFNPETDRSTSVKPLRILQREGAASSFSKEKSLASTTSISKQCLRASICLSTFILLGLFIYGCSTYYRRSYQNGTTKYYVILDCGSTGTRVNVYQSIVVQPKDDKSLPFQLKSLPEDFQQKSSIKSGRAYQRMETEPGLHKLVRNGTGLAFAIKPLLKWAEKQIPNHAHKSTSLFLYATAGVRRLPNSDSEWLLEKAWIILKNSSFICHKEWVKIISGMEEAYYGWLALNYHWGMMGSLSAKGTFGSLDLGGSSLQVTFETEKPVYDGTGINLSLGMVSHHLSAYSLPGYGLNDAFDKSVAQLIKKITTNGKIELTDGEIVLPHPCLQAGYKEIYFCTQCLTVNSGGSPLTGDILGKGASGLSVTLLGAPQWEECSALAKQAVNKSEWSGLGPAIDCKFLPCALGDSLPKPLGKFYATSGFFVVFRFFNLTSKASLNDVLQRGQEFCEKPWAVAKTSVAPQPFIEQYCFRAPYIVSLLRDGLHIRDREVFVGSGSITWTLGVALLEAGKAFSTRFELPYRVLNTDISPSILLLLLLMSVIVLCCAVSCANFPTARFLRRFFLPLFRRNSATTTASSMVIPSPFGLPRWIPLNSGDGKTKMPLSPTVAGPEEHPFSTGYGLGGSSIQFVEQSSLQSGFAHSFSSGSLLQLQIGDGTGSVWAPRGQMLQSRRSQSREDLSSSLAEAHVIKV